MKSFFSFRISSEVLSEVKVIEVGKFSMTTYFGKAIFAFPQPFLSIPHTLPRGGLILPSSFTLFFEAAYLTYS